MAGEGCDSSSTGRTILGGRAGTPGLSGKASKWLYVSLHPTRVENCLAKPRVCQADARSTGRSAIAKWRKYDASYGFAPQPGPKYLARQHHARSSKQWNAEALH